MGSRTKRKKTTVVGATGRRGSRPQNRGVLTGVICIFLAAIVWIAFGQALNHEFVDYDDNVYVYANPRITDGLTLGGIQWAFTRVHANNWHPLTTISHMLDCQLYGLQPWGHHLTNILLHAAAAVLLFLALRQLTGSSSPWDGSVSRKLSRLDRTGNFWASAFAAAVFAVHPLRVESVAWVEKMCSAECSSCSLSGCMRATRAVIGLLLANTF